MSAIALLMGLLVLSYLGSLIVGSGKTRGLASGIEFVGLGLLVGPRALGFIEHPMIVEFAPIVQVALGWLAFVVGLDFGRVEGRRVSLLATLLGIGGALVTGLGVGFAVWRMLAALPVVGMDETSSRLFAGGAAAVCAESARTGVEWVKARWGAAGRVTRLFVDIGAADDLVPLVATAAIFAMVPMPNVSVSLPGYGWFGATLALGALLGIVTAMLLRGAEGDTVWGALVGTLLLVVGTAERFGLATVFATFVMGIALAAASPSRRTLRKMVGPTERAVLYPMLLLAGAHLDPRPLLENKMIAPLVALVLLVRIAGKIVSGLVVHRVSPDAKAGGPWLGLVMLSSGPMSISCAFVLSLRFPGLAGDALLLVAVFSTALGELISTLALKNLLTEAGEIVVRPSAPASPGSMRPSSPPPNSNVRSPSIPPPMPLPSMSLIDISRLDEEDPVDKGPRGGDDDGLPE